MKRALTLALCLMMAAFPAMADGVEFMVTAEVFPDAWPKEQRELAMGLQSLLAQAEAEGEIVTSGDAFHLQFHLGLDGQKRLADFEFFGVPSHFGVRSSLLGDVQLMVNNLALAEFGLKAYSYLGVPLHRASLIVPYVHTSAWDVLKEAASPLLAVQDGEFTLNGEETAALIDRLITLCDENRTVRCYVNALGVDVWALADALHAACADGLTVTRSGGLLTWSSGERTVMQALSSGGRFILTVGVDALNAQVDVSREELFIRLDGDAVESPAFVHAVVKRGLREGDYVLTVCGENGDALLTANVAALDATDSSLTANYTAQDMNGVNVLSVNGTTLAQLMRDAAPSLLREGVKLIAAAPADAVQLLMDALDKTGVLPMLTDAVIYGFDGY